MTTARDLLDCLGRSALVRLSRARGLASTRENEDRRKALAHSYRGKVEALICDLSRTDLVEIFQCQTFCSRNLETYPSNPAKLRVDELRERAIRVFAGRRVGSDFEAAFERHAFEVAVDESCFEEVGTVTEHQEEPQDDASEHPFGRLSRQWSRPRMISRMLSKLGHEVSERLHTRRFQQLISELQMRGIEACFADDASCSKLTSAAQSPGIAAKLRLRLVEDLAPDDASTDETGRDIDPGTAVGKVRETGRAQPDQEAWPHIVRQSGERPVSQRIPRPSDWNLAVHRLQFLTAVPSVQRQSMREWPDAYIAAATGGLKLRPDETSLLRTFSMGLCLGNHSPYDSIPHLVQVMRPTEWTQLLEDFVALNPFQPELVNAIVKLIQHVCASRGEPHMWPVDQPAAEDFLESTPTPRAIEQTLAAAKRRTTELTEDPGTNVRNLGALGGMFDEE